MQKPSKENIQQATKRVKKRLPLDKVRRIPKFKDISLHDYEKLVRNAETFSLLILEALGLQKWTDI